MNTSGNKVLTRCTLALALLGALLVGCGQLRDFTSAPAPQLSEEWKALLAELRALERQIGFKETRNFARLTDERQTYTYCGWAPKSVLPYSYEDPAIRWLESAEAAQCRDADDDNDWYFGQVEAMGEIGTPVTPAMIAGDFDRFAYLVVHEDCHDQFELPYGIEEPLCDIIAHRAMAQFAAKKYPWYARENRALRNYTRMQSRQTRATVTYYRELERLYERFHRSELPFEDLLQSRAVVFGKLERALDLPPGEINNISFANYMTYSRHHAFLESAVARVGPDLAQVVAFFRALDGRKPSPEEVMKRLSLPGRENVDYVRGYERAIIEVIARSVTTRVVAAPRPDA
jgi:hypothetical protein